MAVEDGLDDLGHRSLIRFNGEEEEVKRSFTAGLIDEPH